MIELLFPFGFDTLQYSWVKATIVICTFVDYSVAKEHQQAFLCRCRGSQLIPSICVVNKIQLVNTICLSRIVFCSILFVVLTEMCKTRFVPLTINHTDLEALWKSVFQILSRTPLSRLEVCQTTG
jgi:hypothetical protein